MDIFWIFLALSVLVVVGLILAPMARGQIKAAPRAAYDMQVYRDQLAEIDREVARGSLNAEDAATSRAEIGRRLLAADDAAHHSSQTRQAPRWLNLSLVLGLSAATVAGVFLTYNRIGAPGYPDLPLAERRAAMAESRPSQDQAEARVTQGSIADMALPDVNADPRLPELIAELETAAAERPGDLRGQELLAQFLPRLGRYADARKAQAIVIALKGEAAVAADYIELAELMISATQGYVSPEAENALRQGLSMDPSDPRGRYYAGLTMAQSGRPDLALQIWQQLLDDSPADAGYVPAIEAQIDALREQVAAMGMELPAPGGVDELSEDQQTQIRGMVEGLAARLASDGGSADEWARLVRALIVLGETDRARAIATEAETVFASQPEALALIRAEAANLPPAP
jgi:cytochrome c-type biogenesis protein CcmH